MKLTNPDADVFVPDGAAVGDALTRTTHLAIGAHQDDLEFMALHGILECFGRSDRWFTGVTMTDGSGSARSGPYGRFSDDEMSRVRVAEQRKAAVVGEYGCQIQLMFPSAIVKDSRERSPVADLTKVLANARPEVVYLHNPADKHDTHVAAVLHCIAALRALPSAQRPATVYGCEIWRSLDWLNDVDKQVLPVDAHPNLAASLSAVFDSQITGGKRYDTAILGRRTANATFFESHATDKNNALSWAMDLTPLVKDASLSPAEYTLTFIDRFRDDVERRMNEFAG
jgi:LmbE family N-acetylglucosaminyl deacetylase